MLFTEPTFLFLFLPLLLWLHWLCPKSWRNGLLMLASLLFYGLGEKEYTAIILASILLNYFTGLALTPNAPQQKRRVVLVMGIAANLGLLALFKYANFLVDILNFVLANFGMARIALGTIHLPIGISFFTFQSISYLIDVFRREVEPQKKLVNLALYVALFPQLIAGPIVRYESIVASIYDRSSSLKMLAGGMRRFILGLGKKMIVANTVAYPADQIFGLPRDELTFSLAWLGIICYTLQIYFDFSGYCDMAIGLGKMFGFEFPENFRYPYVARSISDFWRRWHISLSTWFRDYLYIPLGGNRRSDVRTYFNLVVVFFICGLWHGANWGFVFWGLYHGAFLVFERAGFAKILGRTKPILQHLYTMLVVMVGWVFFRVATSSPDGESILSYGWHYCGVLLGINSGNGVRAIAEYFNIYVLLVICLGIIGATPIYSWLDRQIKQRSLLDAVAADAERPNRRRRRSEPSALRGNPQDRAASPLALASWGENCLCIYLLGVLFYSMVLVASDSYNPFIYFQF